MGRRKRFSPKEMENKWELYKLYCDTRKKTVQYFSPQKFAVLNAETAAPVPYDIKGFVAFIMLSETAFYKTYAGDTRYACLIERIKLECENSKREAFEQGTIPSALAGLWMRPYGYSTHNDTSVEGAVPVVIDGGDALADD